MDAEQEEAAKTLQDEIDELHAMLKDQFSKDEDAVRAGGTAEGNVF